MLFSLQKSNIPAANNFPAFSEPECTLPHTASTDLTVLATASYTYRPDNIDNFLFWLLPKRIPKEDSTSGYCWLDKSRNGIIWLPKQGFGVRLWCSRDELFGIQVYSCNPLKCTRKRNKCQFLTDPIVFKNKIPNWFS